MEKVLVTGAAGYIGSHVVSSLLDMGYDVIATDLKSDNIDSRANYIPSDIFSDDDIYNKLDCPDRIIHLAWKDGFVHNALSHLEFLPKHYSFLKKMIDCGVKSISVMGSMHEVGFFEGAIKADTPTNPSSLYGISKNALRQSLIVANKSQPFSLHWLRGFYICGDDRRNNSIFAKILQKSDEGAKDFPFNTGKNKYDFISLENLALEIALASVQDDVCGIINCCSGKSVSLKDKVEQFLKENNIEIKLNYGAFPDRPYDSKEIYGDNTEIKKIVLSSVGKFNLETDNKIKILLSNLA